MICLDLDLAASVRSAFGREGALFRLNGHVTISPRYYFASMVTLLFRLHGRYPPSPSPVGALLPLLHQQGGATTGAASRAPPPRPLALWESVVLGGSSAAVAGTLVFPMDTVKVRPPG